LKLLLEFFQLPHGIPLLLLAEGHDTMRPLP